MLRCLLSFILFSFFLQHPASAQDEKELVKSVKAKLDKVSDYQASGKMKIDVSFINAPESKVNVYYKKPNKFRIKKAGGISILPKGGVSISVNSLMLEGSYEAFNAGTEVIKGFTVKKVRVVPLDDAGDVVLLTLFIDEKNLLIRKTSITTRESGSYEMEMDYGNYSQWGLPDKVKFIFNTKDYKLPKGITMEYQKSGEKKEEKLKNKKGSVEISYSFYTINKGVDDKVFL
jgi:hypothetical protein